MNILAQSAAVRRRAAVACGVLASLLFVCGSAAAQFGPSIPLPPGLPTVTPAPPGTYPATVASTAAVPYYAPPAWSQTLAPNVRFVILSNFNNDAVLDRETGLVWARQSLLRTFPSGVPVGEPGIRGNAAEGMCRWLSVGNRTGWRLPAVAELQSLVDASVPLTSGPRLPAGHPFLLSPGGINPTHSFWSGEVYFRLGRRFVALRTGEPFTALMNFSAMDVLCVRGGRALLTDSAF